jgi:phospholipid/cholesterol/gamma-HCH transport system substrate-binding protein
MEILVGLFMTLGLVALFFLAMQVSNLGAFRSDDGYPLVAYFENVGSLKAKAPVTMAGVEVGRVASIGYDPDSYRAKVTLMIYPDFDRIPEDSFAKILTAGLLGEQYVGIDPGGSIDYLGAGSELQYTQSALVLEEVVGQFIFSKASEGG